VTGPGAVLVGEPALVVVADPAAAAEVAARHIAAALADAVAARGRAHWATTGGSTPVAIYRHLVTSPLRETVPWEAVHVWWGDDRFVPVDHPESNVKAFDDVMLGLAGGEEGATGGDGMALPISPANVHPFPTAEAIAETRGAAWCATTLGDTLRAAGLDEVGGWPVFDLILLGIGPDGHLLSAFPGSAALDSTDLALAVPAPTHIGPHIERVTLNPAVIGVARDVLVVVHGADKAASVAAILGPERDSRRWPGQLARRAGATWVLDEAAAAALAR
jgi:6-phosphogluconolactonase